MAGKRPIGALKWLAIHRPGMTMREFLVEHYVRRRMDSREIAEMTGVGLSGWQLQVRKHGLARSLSDARRKFWRSQRGKVIKDQSFRRVWTGLSEPRPQVTGIQRRLLKSRQGGVCPLCGDQLLPYLTRIHHVKALVLGGANGLSNMIALCYRCHDMLHLGDIDTAIALRDAFYRCATCGSHLTPESSKVFRCGVPSRPKSSADFECLMCASCLQRAQKGEDDLRRRVLLLMGEKIDEV